MDWDRHYLMRINQCVGHIKDLTRGGRAEFMESMAIRHAVLWNVQLIAVAARHLSEGARDMHPEIDWSHTCELCHEVIGNPWEVDREKVWRCAKQELPGLKHRVREILLDRRMK